MFWWPWEVAELTVAGTWTHRVDQPCFEAQPPAVDMASNGSHFLFSDSHVELAAEAPNMLVGESNMNIPGQSDAMSPQPRVVVVTSSSPPPPRETSTKHRQHPRIVVLNSMTRSSSDHDESGGHASASGSSSRYRITENLPRRDSVQMLLLGSNYDVPKDAIPSVRV